MSQSSTQTADEITSIGCRAAARRLSILLVLVLAVFRDECRRIVWDSTVFSDWSHTLVLPLVIGAFCWCRRSDLRAALTAGSGWGLVVILLGAAMWFATKSLGLFGYLSLIAIPLVVAGAVLVTHGGTVAKLCLPAFFMMTTCLPLSERSMERFSIATQRVSLDGAISALKALPNMEISAHGTAIAYQHGTSSGKIGLGEQRLGFRLIPAGIMIGLFIGYSCRRPAWQIIPLIFASIPFLLVSNVIRIVTTALVAIYGNYSPVSNVPRNTSIVVGLIAVYLLFSLASWVLCQLPRLEYLFLVDDESNAPDASTPPGATDEGAS